MIDALLAGAEGALAAMAAVAFVVGGVPALLSLGLWLSGSIAP